MSGSGSGGGFGGGSGDGAIACERLIIETAISSPKQEVIEHLKQGDTLQVELSQQSGTSVIVLKHNGQVAGGITHASAPRLRECIQAGTAYSATVIDKTNGQVRVRIKPI